MEKFNIAGALADRQQAAASLVQYAVRNMPVFDPLISKLTGSNYDVYEQLLYLPRHKVPNIDIEAEGLLLDDDPNAKGLPANWETAAVLGGDKEVIDYRMKTGVEKIHAVAFQIYKRHHVGVMATRGALFGQLVSDPSKIGFAPRRGPGPVRYWLGTYTPLHRRFVPLNDGEMEIIIPKIHLRELPDNEPHIKAT